jgi:hypothetical protein
MTKCSDKSIAELSAPELSAQTTSKNDNKLLEKKINALTEGFGTNRFCELILRDRNRLSEENALAVSDYIIAMKREVNPRLNYKRSIIQTYYEILRDLGHTSDSMNDVITVILGKVLQAGDSSRSPQPTST